MERNGWDQRALAKALGVAQQTVSNFLSGRHGTGLAVALTVSRLSGAESLEALLAGEASDGPRVEYDADERYPNRSAALKPIVGDLHPETVSRITSMKLKSNSDLTKLEWLGLILDEEKRVRLEFGDDEPAR